MILEAVYEGRHPRVTVPGFAGKTVARGERVKIRIVDGAKVPASWKITKGEVEYKAARDKFEADLIAQREERATIKAAARDEARAKKESAIGAKIDRLVAGGEVDATASKKKSAKPAEGGGS